MTPFEQSATIMAVKRCYRAKIDAKRYKEKSLALIGSLQEKRDSHQEPRLFSNYMKTAQHTHE
jgi:hypothetical protein